MPLQIIRGDLTTLKVDAIVNAANEGLRQGGGICGAIFRAAGEEQMTLACSAIGHCATGQAVITPGFALPARYVLHTPGPVWQGGHADEAALLASCYRSALTLAVQWELSSIAFPLIAGGIYGYPKAQAMQVAVAAIRDFLTQEACDDLQVTLCLYDHQAYLAGSELWGHITAYITDAEVVVERRSARSDRSDPTLGAHRVLMQRRPETSAASVPECMADEMSGDLFDSSLRNWMERHAQSQTTFTEHLLHLIDQSGATDPEIYKRANLDRKLFSKIRSNVHYQPSKSTVLALCMALHLNRREADALLVRAGYALTTTNRRDLAVIWCLEHGRWDVYELNMLLFDMDLPGLGA